MVQNFKIENMYDYSQLVQTEKIQNILNNLPEGLSKLEKAYYVYIELGKIISEDPNYVLASIKNRNIWYYEPIDEEYYGICKSISELYVTILQDERIGIEADLVKNFPELNTGSHVDTILKIDGKYYIANLIADLVNIKTNRRVNSFGLDANRVLKTRKEDMANLIIEFASQERTIKSDNEENSMMYEYIMQMLEKIDKEENYELLHKFADKIVSGEKSNKRIHRMIDRFKIVNKYSRNLDEEYGAINTLSRADLEKMDLKLGYSYGRIQSENGGHERGIYTNDVIHQLQKELENPEKVEKYIFSGREVPEEEKLDYKMEYICNNIYKFIETTADMNYLEQIMNFSKFAENFVSREEGQRIIPYAIKVGKSNRDIVSVIKVKPMHEGEKNTYYLYSKEEKTYFRKTAQELKDYLNQFNPDDVHIIGTFREYSKTLDSLNDKKQIEDELEG